MQGGDLFKPRKRTRQNALPKESPKRKVEKKRYIDLIKEFREECKQNGTYICFFCNKKDDEQLFVHPLRGRTGKFYIDKEYFVWAHMDCRGKFYDYSVEALKKEPWYKEFMKRLKEKDTHSYYKQLKKEEKAQLDLDF